MNHISIICLGVTDMKRSIVFYRELGFQSDETEDNPAVIFFNTTGTKFELFPFQNLVLDINASSPPAIRPGFSGITLAYNVPKKEQVNEVIEMARRAGATIAKEPTDVFWGGYHAYFTDPDGYYWEVAWGPNFHYDEQDLLVFDDL